VYDDPNLAGDYHGPRVYSGVRADAQALGSMFNPQSPAEKEGRGLWPFFLIDLPLSFIVDTLMLPVTIYEELSKRKKMEEKVDTR